MPPDVIYNQWVRDGQPHTGKAWKAVVYSSDRPPDTWSPSNFTTDLSNNNFTTNHNASFNGTGSGPRTSNAFSHKDQALLNKTFPASKLTASLKDNSTSDSDSHSGGKNLARRTYGNSLSDSEVVQLARNPSWQQHHVPMGFSHAETWRRRPQHGPSYPLNSAFMSTQGLCGCTAIVMWSPNGVFLGHVREATADPARFGPWWINWPETQNEQRSLDGEFIQEAQALVEEWAFLRHSDGSLVMSEPDYQRDHGGRTIYDRHGRPIPVPGTGGRPVWDSQRFPKQYTEAIIIAPHKNPNYIFHTDPLQTGEPRGQPMPNDYFHPAQVAGIQSLFRDWGVAYTTVRYHPRQIGPGKNQAHMTDSKDIVLLNIEENSRDKRELEIRLYYDAQRSGLKMRLGRDRSPSPQTGSSSRSGRHH